MSAKRSILLVDDDHDTLDLLEVILFKDYELGTCLNGFEGLSRAQQEHPDLVITDIMMPVMDGIKLINSLRHQPETAGIPVVAITSFTEKHSVKGLLNVGFRDVITKPFSREDVLSTIRGILGDERKDSPSRA